MSISCVDAAQILQTSLNLRQAPIAISFADSEPPSVNKHSGRVPAGCRFWENALDGAFSTSPADHQMCAIGVFTHHLEPSPGQHTDLEDALKVFRELGYVRPEDLPLIPVLKQSPSYVIYSPLAGTDSQPDVVLLFVNGAQALILSEATQQIEGVNAPAMGRPACAVIPQVMNSGCAAVSLGCCGARAYLDVLKDDVAIFALPGKKLDPYLERVQVLAVANATLSRFHLLRRHDVEAGRTPSMQASLAAFSK